MGAEELNKALNMEPGSGGDFVPVPLANEYFEFISRKAKGRQLFTVVPMEKDKVMYPALTGEFNVYYIPPGMRAVLSQFETDHVDLEAKRFMVATNIEETLLENANVNFMPIVENGFANAMGKGEDLAMVQGDPSHKATADKPSEATEDDWFVFDPRCSYQGLIDKALQDGPTPIDLAGGDITTNLYTEIAASLGKYADDPTLLATLIHPTTAYRQLWPLDAFIEASKYGTVQTLWTGEIGRIYGIRQILWGAMPQHTLLTTPIYNVFIGDTKHYKFRTETDIYSEQIGVVNSMRACIGAPYPDALQIVQNVGA